jgi:hypothetical protein
MKTRIAIITACASTLALTATLAHAGGNGIVAVTTGFGDKTVGKTTHALPKHQKQTKVGGALQPPSGFPDAAISTTPSNINHPDPK